MTTSAPRPHALSEGSDHTSLRPRRAGARLRLRTVARTFPTLLELIGKTPVVRLQKVGAELGCALLAKLEYMNPGGSNKDRIGLSMVEAAERDGKLKPGGTIVEPTSGNTGVGLALAAAIKGYSLICVVPDKVAAEKIALLRAFGAEVVICPTAVEPDSPESYYSVSDRLAEEIPGAYKPDQYSNERESRRALRDDGPGDLGAGRATSSTPSSSPSAPAARSPASARYLKEQKPELVVVGADPEGRSSPPRTRAASTRISSRESARTRSPRRSTRRWSTSTCASPTATRSSPRAGSHARRGSSAAARRERRCSRCSRRQAGTGPGKTILTTIPDGGRGYLSKLFDDNWMLEHGMLERRGALPTISEVLAYTHAPTAAGARPRRLRGPPEARRGDRADAALRDLAARRSSGAQPAESVTDVIGSLTERGLLDRDPPQPGRARRGRRRRDGPAAACGRRERLGPRRLRRPHARRCGRARGPSRRARGRAHTLRPARVPRAPPSVLLLYDSAGVGQLLQGAAAARPARRPYERATSWTRASAGARTCSAARTPRSACPC